MPAYFTPKLKILPPGQRELWPLLAGVPGHFALYGGTAVAIQLGHRESVDFDFFSSQSFDPNQLRSGLAFLHSGRVTQSSENTYSCIVPLAKGQAQVSFFGDLPLARVDDSLLAEDNRIHVASLLDLGGMKLAVIQKRGEAKDYLDIAAVLDAGETLERLLSAGRAIYGKQFNPAVAVRALAFFDDLKGDQLSVAAKRTIPERHRLHTLGQLACTPAARDNRGCRIATMMMPADLQPVVEQTVWWEPARSQAKADLDFFLPYAMAYASDEDLSRVRRHVADDQLRAALRNAPVGLFDLQSWQYWHTILGVSPIPPRPLRAFLNEDAELEDRFSKCVRRSLPISA